jgi:hypothetical protein
MHFRLNNAKYAPCRLPFADTSPDDYGAREWTNDVKLVNCKGCLKSFKTSERDYCKACGAHLTYQNMLGFYKGAERYCKQTRCEIAYYIVQYDKIVKTIKELNARFQFEENEKKKELDTKPAIVVEAKVVENKRPPVDWPYGNYDPY